MSDRAPSAAEDARAQAEADKFAAEAEKARHEARVAKAEADQAELELDKAREKRERERHADAYRDRTYRFLDAVTDPSILKCINQLDAWHREDPTCDIKIVFDSGGGGVIEGFHLYDHILELRETHRIDTVARGMTASMAGILMQAGETRTMGSNATFMIHEVAMGASGKLSEIEDRVDMGKMLNLRGLKIYADRCKNAPTATKPLTLARLKRDSTRKDWWIDAEDALAFGLVDEIR